MEFQIFVFHIRGKSSWKPIFYILHRCVRKWCPFLSTRMDASLKIQCTGIKSKKTNKQIKLSNTPQDGKHNFYMKTPIEGEKPRSEKLITIEWLQDILIAHFPSQYIDLWTVVVLAKLFTATTTRAHRSSYLILQQHLENQDVQIFYKKVETTNLLD